MARDWLLVETLGSEPAVVAQGRRSQNLVPLSEFLRRSTFLSAIQTAIAETVETGSSLTSITPKGNLIRTEPVRMPDGTVHGVHVWFGSAKAKPPERPIPGPLVWDLTTGIATDTPESLANSGLDDESEPGEGRAFAEDLPARKLGPSETQDLPTVLHQGPGIILCDTWNTTSQKGEEFTVGFVVRTILEPGTSGDDHLIARAMNWRSDPPPAQDAEDKS